MMKNLAFAIILILGFITVSEAQITADNYASSVCTFVTNPFLKSVVLNAMNSTFLSLNMTEEYPHATKYFIDSYKQFIAGGAKCIKFFANLEIPFRADLQMNKKRYTNIKQFLYDLAMSKLGSLPGVG